MERRNQEIKKSLRLRLGGGAQDEWDRHLPEIIFNTRRRNAATGQAPAELLLCKNRARPRERPVTNPADLQHRVETARANQEAHMPTEPEKGPNSPRVGNLVYTKKSLVVRRCQQVECWFSPALDRSFRGRRTLRIGNFQNPCPRGKMVKYHISQLKRANTAIHQQAENDEIPVANDSPDDPDPPQRKRSRPRKPILIPRANTTPDKITRSEKEENLNQDKTPSSFAVPRRRQGRPRKDVAKTKDHQVR
jgi:hypothetical protein